MAKSAPNYVANSHKITEKEFAKGGTTKMFGKQSATTAVAGSSSGKGEAATQSGGKYAVGGTGHMFGKQSASTAVPGTTSGKG